jgi:tetratricopeptide (TPR) repeat protein
MSAKSRKKLDMGASILAAPQPARPRLADAGMGDATSQAAMDRLNQAVGELKAIAAAPLLSRAVAAIGEEDPQTAAKLAIEVLNGDDHNGLAWYVLAVAREKAGDFKNSIKAYEAALALLPDNPDIANDLGRLAYRMGEKRLAGQLFVRYREARPDCPHGANNLACVLRDLHEYDAAIELLQQAIGAHPGDALLWNTLGTVVSARGDATNALTFFDEALNLDSSFA